ncbi:MAG: UDP-N-acetylglucosamine 1-carboxyvinyltransferase [Candidatus Buchananbacteria bacterium]
MEKYQIIGGNQLTGEIPVAGAKNAALKILAASLLSTKPLTITNLPVIEDINRMKDLLLDLGAKISNTTTSTIIDTSTVAKTSPTPELVRKLRSSVMLAGPLLARFGEVTLVHPGGCIIGKRPIDLFLEGFKALGAEVVEQADGYQLKAKKLTGAKIILPKVSVTVTEAIMMTATLANGTTRIINAAMEPEIPALADYLNNQGAKISGAGTSEIIIEGVQELSAGEFTLIPDRIETGTFVILGALTNSEITVTNCQPAHLEILWSILQKIGVPLEIGTNQITTKPWKKLQANDLITHEYPGFPTDLQAPMTVLLTQAQGPSLIHETIFEGRLFYTDILNQMGANIIMCDPHRVVVNGPTKLFGRHLTSPDLRAGMALVLAALIAEGNSEIENIYQIDRGYSNIVSRLGKLGAKINKITE